MAIDATETNPFSASFWDMAACSSEADTGTGAAVVRTPRYHISGLRSDPRAFPSQVRHHYAEFTAGHPRRDFRICRQTLHRTQIEARREAERWAEDMRLGP